MKYLFILLLTLVVIPVQAADNAPTDDTATSQSTDSTPKSDNATQKKENKKPAEGEEEEEPDCD